MLWCYVISRCACGRAQGQVIEFCESRGFSPQALEDAEEE
jgi:hypothetical protein